MLYQFLQHEVIFRSLLSIFLSFFTVILSTPFFIKKLKQIQKNGQPIRDDGPITHLSKSGTPTCGGVIIIFGTFIAQLFLIDFSNYYIKICWFILLSFACFGLYDDYMKITKQHSSGISAKLKFSLQILASSIALYFINLNDDLGIITYIQTPYLKEFLVNFSFFYFIFALIVITGSSNAVNLTDGLDGLVSIPIIFTCLGLVIITFIVSDRNLAVKYSLFHIENSQEIIVLLSALIGSIFGFLWVNSYPASIFMGDVGSLSIGAMLGTISIILKNEILFAVIAALFAIETLSVIIQVYYFKTTKGKRIFLMAPLHHHFEKLGIPETKVVIRFWIVSFLFLVLGLMNFC